MIAYSRAIWMFRRREPMWDESDGSGSGRVWTADRNCGEIQFPSSFIRCCFVYDVISRLTPSQKNCTRTRTKRVSRRSTRGIFVAVSE